MSYWTNVRTSFFLSCKDPIPYSFNELVERAAKKAGILGADEKLIKVHDGIQPPSAGDVIRILQADEDEWDSVLHEDFELRSSDGNTWFRIPILPMTPTGSEGNLNVSSSFVAQFGVVDYFNITAEGPLRDFDDYCTPYIDFWIKVVSAILGTGVLYTYSHYEDKRHTGYESLHYTREESIFDDEDKETNEKAVDILSKYLLFYKEWKAKRKETGEYANWIYFVCEKLSENVEN